MDGQINKKIDIPWNSCEKLVVTKHNIRVYIFLGIYSTCLRVMAPPRVSVLGVIYWADRRLVIWHEFALLKLAFSYIFTFDRFLCCTCFRHPIVLHGSSSRCDFSGLIEDDMWTVLFLPCYGQVMPQADLIQVIYSVFTHYFLQVLFLYTYWKHKCTTTGKLGLWEIT